MPTEVAPAPSRRVRRDIAVPYYAQLAEIIEGDIASGLWHPGDSLPSEADLCSLHGVSRTAVRQALGELSARGLVRKEKGRRTFVARSRVTSLVVQEMRGFMDEVSQQGGHVGTVVLRQEVLPALPDIARDLQVPTGSDVVLVSRLRTVDGGAVVSVETYLPASRFRGLAEMDLSGLSLYAVLAAEFAVRPSSGSRVIEAVAADRAVASAIGIKTGAPLLKLTAINKDEDGVPFEVFHAWYRGDETRFELVVGSEHR
jgi:GntR family transcriptional regulator